LKREKITPLTDSERRRRRRKKKRKKKKKKKEEKTSFLISLFSFFVCFLGKIFLGLTRCDLK
jgi:hypothetical protein